MSGGEWAGVGCLLVLWALVIWSVALHERKDDDR